MTGMIEITQSLLTPASLLLIALGTSLGIIVGAMPGLTGAMLITLSLPLTFSMSGEHALTLLVSMYVGSVSGGLITATLLRIPGTPASMMTTLDSYPMAVSGEGHRALGLGIFASFVGGTVGWVFLVLAAGPLARLSLYLGPFDFFALVLLALVLIATVSGDSLSRGMFSGFLGILFSMIGASPATGTPRLTMGIHALADGLKLLPVLIGLFAISQVFSQLSSTAESRATNKLRVAGTRLRIGELARHWRNLIRSSLIGTFVGILPGIGANIGSVVAYAAAKNASQTPDRFGHGSEEGIIASESANNATVGGALIPLIAMGIPGSVIDAILLGALTIHGLQPGPMMMEHNPRAVGQIIGTMLLANLLMFCLMLASVRWIVRVVAIPKWLLQPVILTLCVVGSYALANRMFDVWVMLVMGVAGIGMDRLRIPVAPFVIGFVLSPIAERHLTEGLMQSGGSWSPLFTQPFALLFVIVSLGTLGVTVFRHNAVPHSTRPCP